MSEVISKDWVYFSLFRDLDNQFNLRVHAEFDFKAREEIAKCPDKIEIMEVYADQSRALRLFKPFVNLGGDKPPVPLRI